MKVSYNWLNEFLKGKAPKPEKMADLLTMNSMEVESIADFTPTTRGLDADKLKPINDFVLDVKTLPNNNHSCLCHRGIAREVAVLADIKVENNSRKFKDYSVSKTSKKLSIKIQDEKKCRRYVGRIIEGVSGGPSPKWLKEKLETLGQRSINNIVDATNFVMLEIGQPMHVFDADKLKGQEIEISVQNAKSSDWITTLDKKEVQLDESVLVIANNDVPLAIAGIKGGIHAELDEKTKNIVLESANFDPVLIRKTAQKIKIQTDASKRYENDYSPEMAGEAMEILTKLIVEIAGTKDTKVGEVIDNYPRRANKYKLGISSEEASSIIGVKITDKDIEKIFDRFGFEYKKVKPIDEVLKLAPTFVETPYKFGASVSYDAPRFFDCSGFLCYLFREAGVQIPRMSVDQYIFGKSVLEKDLKVGDTIYSNTGVGKIHYESVEFLPKTKVPEGVDHCGLYLGDGKVAHSSGSNGKMAIEDLKSAKYFKKIVGYRRMTENTERFVVTVPDERLDLRIKEDLAEEIGKVYGYDKIKDVSLGKSSNQVVIEKSFAYKEKIRKILYNEGFSEVINYTFVDKGELELANPMSPEKRYLRTNLTDGLKKSLEFNSRYVDLIEMPQIRIFEFGHVFTNNGEKSRFAFGVKNPLGIKKPKEQDVLNDVIVLIEKGLGMQTGLPRSARNDNNTENIVEFDFDAILNNLPEIKEYDFSEIGNKDAMFKKISQYPFMTRDIAVFTPDGTKAEDVYSIISKEVNELMIKCRLFDVFTKKFPDGFSKTSYAYRLIFQSYEKTLSDAEVNAIMEKITKKMNEKGGWQVR